MTNPNTKVIPKSDRLLTALDNHIVDYFHDANGTGYLKVLRGTRRETIAVYSSAGRRLVQETAYKETGRGINRNKLEETMGTLDARCHFDGMFKQIYRRIGEAANGDIEIDLGDETGRCVRVTKDGYSLEHPTINFIKSEGMLALPEPANDGSLAPLWDIVNVPEETEKCLLVGWMVSALAPNSEYPLLVLQGEQGSGKSFAADTIKTLVDPAKVTKQAPISSEQDLFINAQQNHVMSFDNLSGMRHEVADAFCRIATGGAHVARKLYTNGEQSVNEACNPVILNGIEDMTTRPDLLSRSFVVHLPVLKRKISARELKEKLEQSKAIILGGLLRGLVSALRNRDTTILDNPPRLAETATFITAAESGLGWKSGSFMKAYEQNQRSSVISGLELDPVVPKLVRFVQMRFEKASEFTITATELMDAIKPLDQKDRPMNWPKTSGAFSAHISRVSSALREIGIEITRERIASKRMIIIRKNFDTYDPDIILGGCQWEEDTF
jgi:putative DNA primase/helicase